MYPLPFAPATGDTFNVAFGCDHTQATCVAKFNNLAEFPRLPLRAAAATGLLSDAAAYRAGDAIRGLVRSREARAAVVAEARSWSGRPIIMRPTSRDTASTAPCFWSGSIAILALVEKFDPRPYTQDWFLHRDEERYLGFLLARSHEVRTPLEGDIVLFRIGPLFRACRDCVAR